MMRDEMNEVFISSPKKSHSLGDSMRSSIVQRGHL